MRKLYEITNDIEFLMINCTDEDAVIIDEQLADSLEALELERDEKLLACGKMYKCLSYEIESYKAEKKRVEAIIKTEENNLKSFKTYITSNWDGGVLKDTQVEFKKTAGSLKYSDKEKVPNEYKREEIKIEAKIDGVKIKKLIQSGVEVPGAYIEPGLRVV